MLDRRRATCGMRAAGCRVAARRKTCRKVRPPPDQPQKGINMASVSVKPAIGRLEDDIGRSRPASAPKRTASARSAPLHALEDDVVGGLQRQVQVRHRGSSAMRPWDLVGFHLIDGGEARAFGSAPGAGCGARAAQSHVARQASAVVGDIDAGGDDLGVAGRHQRALVTTSPAGTERDGPGRRE